MLILSAERAREHGGTPRNLGLYEQEDNGGVWSISKTNMTGWPTPIRPEKADEILL